MVLAFLTGTPYALLDYRSFFNGLLYDVNHLHQEGVEYFVALGRGWIRHRKYTLPYGLGWSLLGISLAGFVWLSKKDIKFFFTKKGNKKNCFFAVTA